MVKGPLIFDIDQLQKLPRTQRTPPSSSFHMASRAADPIHLRKHSAEVMTDDYSSDEDDEGSSRAVTARCRKCRTEIGEFYNSFVKVCNSGYSYTPIASEATRKA